MDRFLKFGRVAAVSLSLFFGSMGVTSVAAQDTPDVPAVEDEDDGFDDWGLLGLLGLAGLLGLRKRTEHDVRVVDRPVNTPGNPRP